MAGLPTAGRQDEVVAVVLGWALWAVGAVAAAAVVARARATPWRSSMTWPGAAAVAVLSGAQLGHLLSPGHRGPLALVTSVGVVAATLALTAAVTGMLRLHRRMDTAHEWLDLASGALLAVAVVMAPLVGPLARASGQGGGAAALALLAPALACFTLSATVAAVRTVGVRAHPRARAFALALALLVVATSAGAARMTGWHAGALAVVEQVALTSVLVTLAASACLPEPPVRVAVEPLDAVMRGRLLQLIVIGAMLGIDHVVGLPSVAVALALGAMAVQLLAIALVYRLVTSLRATRHEAMTDELTGLGNRRALTAALSSALRAAGGGGAAALVLIDLDRFKEVNDVMGHAAGDELLRQVAARLRERADADEVLARQGGDEFAVVVLGAGAAQAAARSRGIAARLAAPFVLAGRPVGVSASIGVAAVPEHASTAEELLQMADSAMYAAKAGGGGTRVYDRATDRVRRREAAMAADLGRAIGTDQMALAFQPQLCATSGTVVGIEALVRWKHPALGTLGASAFLPLAAQHGFMEALTAQVLHGALAAARALDDGGPLAGIRLSVNVSASSLHHADLVATVRAALAEHGVPPERLVLEITETELMVDPTASHRVVTALVDLGVGVSIDDYGTGHSSLVYLRDLPAAELKLDRSFVAALTTDPRTADIVRTTVDLAHSLGLRLVTEGVEDAATLAAVAAVGADVTQGYYHCGPLSLPTLRVWAGLARQAGRSTATAAAAAAIAAEEPAPARTAAGSRAGAARPGAEPSRTEAPTPSPAPAQRPGPLAPTPAAAQRPAPLAPEPASREALAPLGAP